MKVPAEQLGGRVKERDRSLTQVYAPADALRFVQAIHADAEATYLTLPEAPGADGGPQTFHGALAEGLPDVEAANRAGHGIFMMVNAGDGRGRRSSNVTGIRALFVDLDGAPLPDSWPLEPHLIVETSQGKWHAYWRVNDVPLHWFRKLQIALAALFDGDPAVSDLPRVMRVPGFYHLKGDPFRVRLLRADDRSAYGLSDFLDGMIGLAEKLEERKQTPLVTTTPRNAREREQLRRYAAAVYRAETEDARLARPGERHEKLVRAAGRVLPFVAAGALPEDFVVSELRDVGIAVGLDPKEVDRIIAWGLHAGQERPRGLPVREGVAGR